MQYCAKVMQMIINECRDYCDIFKTVYCHSIVRYMFISPKIIYDNVKSLLLQSQLFEKAGGVFNVFNAVSKSFYLASILVFLLFSLFALEETINLGKVHYYNFCCFLGSDNKTKPAMLLGCGITFTVYL